MIDPRTAEIRTTLLEICRDRYMKTLGSADPYGDRRLVRDGLLAAENTIRQVAIEGANARDYLSAVMTALELEHRRLAADDADDEDHYTSGAVRTIAIAAEALAKSLPK